MTRLNIEKIQKFKNKRPIVCLTAYTAGMAEAIDDHVDIILIGDSVANVLYGMNNTQKISLDTIKEHGKAVCKSSKQAFTIIDMPYKTFENKKIALKNAIKLIKYTKCQSIKIETQKKDVKIISHLVENGLTVVGHIGVTPQSYTDFSKIKVLGRNLNEKKNLLKLAIDVEKAGASLLVLECITAQLSEEITNTINIPTIGIGSSNRCDGQVLVINDLLGINKSNKKIKFVKNYANLSKNISDAAKSYKIEVRNRKFPNKKYQYE